MRLNGKLSTQVALNLAVMATFSATAWGQNNSLHKSDQQQTVPMTLGTSSWTYQAAEEPKGYKLNELIHVDVSISSNFISDGKVDRNKTGYSDWQLPNWIKFYGNNLGADGLPNGVPHVRGQIDQQLQAEGKLQEKDSLKFNITCHVVDIRPNGNLLLEGQTNVKNNEENWEFSLTGEVRASDIQGNSQTIQSDKIADLKIIKREAGHVRDSYRRGWAMEWLDKWAPF
jgi:flagellar L-ring protein precursor FlgH